MSLENDLARLNEQQAAFIKKFKGPSIVVAGPGTGKTRTVSVLIGDLLHKKTRLREILALSFSEKAATELRDRVLEYYPHSFDECWISTFHSFCARILREQYHHVGINPEFKLLTSFKEALLLATICKKQHPEAFSEFGRVINKRGFQQEVLAFISLLKSNLVEPDQFLDAIDNCDQLNQRIKSRLREIHNLYVLYEKERLKTGYLDFRDLIALAIKVLQIDGVAAIYRDKFKVILVDEFQDTDPAQFMLLTLLKGDDEKKKIAVIGDPRQSIYRFRGADPGMMSTTGPFKKKYRARVFPLQINYRSTRNIVETSGRLHWQDKSFQELELKAFSEASGFTSFYRVRDELEEARFLSRKIASLLIYGEKRKYNPHEIAVLVRNNYQIDLLAECLQALHVPFEIAGDMKFFRSEEVIVLASLLKIASEIQHEVEDALKRAFSSPLFGINALWVQAIFAELSQTTSMSHILENISEQKFDKLPETDEDNLIRAGFFAETVKMLQHTQELPLSVVFARMLLTLKDSLQDPESDQARNILHFRAMIADYCEIFQRQNDREAAVSDLMGEFDEWLTYYASTLEQSQNTTGAGVKIMTVHQSKGLEFPVVVVPGLSEGLFPVNHRESLLVPTAALEALKKYFNDKNHEPEFFNPYPVTYEDHLEEERRLFYVALTRAEEGFILTSPRQIGSEPAMPAPFIDEAKLTSGETDLDDRPLTASEFRTLCSRLNLEQLQILEPHIIEAEINMPSDRFIHGFRPREFAVSESDKIILPDNLALSATSLKNFVDCPRRFYFIDILKIQNPLLAKQSYFIVGNAFHSCLEKLHHPDSVWSKGKYPSDEDLEQIFESVAMPMLTELDFFERHLQVQSIKNALPLYRDAIFNHEQFPPHHTKGVEFPFSFEYGGCQIRGRFDRLIQQDDGLIVVDYKTSGSNRKSAQKLFELAFPEEGWPHELQLPTYLLACHKLGFKKASVALLYVKQDPYKRKSKEMLAGYLRSSAFNQGFGPSFGLDIPHEAFAKFEQNLCEIITAIKDHQVFDCEPSANSEARSCLNFDQNKKPRCEFFAFCQERLEQKRMTKVPYYD